MRETGDHRRVLLIRRKALGDILVTLPAVHDVVREWPMAQVDLVIDRPFADLVAKLVPAVRVLSWPPPAGESWWRTLRQGRYDLVIDWLGNPRTAMWTIGTGAPLRVGYDLPRRRWAYNVRVPRNREQDRDLRGFAGEAFLDPLRSLGIGPAGWRDGFAAWARTRGPDFWPLSAEVAAWATAWLERPGVPVVLVMSATWPAKMWPAAKVVELLHGLPALGANPVLVPGPGDEWLVAAVGRKDTGALVAPPTSLLELAHIIGRAELFVGTDCGPRHLAAALGLPTVTVFGPTDPSAWNPSTGRHVAVTRPVACAPCDLTRCPVAGHPCLDELSSDAVIAAVAAMMTRLAEGATGVHSI